MDSKHFLMLSELFENFRTQALALLKEAEEFGFIDDLTCCYNRKAFELRKEQLLNIPTGIIFIDVNGLKYINDTQGHDAGDLALRDLGRMLKSYFGGNNVFRIGGDEFVILKPKVTTEVFDDMVEEFQIAIDTLHRTSVAIGYVVSGVDYTLKDALIKAEQDMYVDKEKFYQVHPEQKR